MVELRRTTAPTETTTALKPAIRLQAQDSPSTVVQPVWRRWMLAGSLVVFLAMAGSALAFVSTRPPATSSAARLSASATATPLLAATPVVVNHGRITVIPTQSLAGATTASAVPSALVVALAASPAPSVPTVAPSPAPSVPTVAPSPTSLPPTNTPPTSAPSATTIPPTAPGRAHAPPILQPNPPASP